MDYIGGTGLDSGFDQICIAGTVKAWPQYDIIGLKRGFDTDFEKVELIYTVLYRCNHDVWTESWSKLKITAQKKETRDSCHNFQIP